MRLDLEDCGGSVVIVDGGSTDGTAVVAAGLAEEFSDVAFLKNPARLQSPGINAAVRRFGDGHSHVIRADAHCDYPKGFISALARDAAETGAAAVAVGMVAEGETLLQRINSSAQNSRIGNGGSSHRKQGTGRYVYHGHHALIRLDAFNEIGGYDESFSHNEDAEFDYRLVQAGHRIWLSARTHVVYFPRSHVGALARQYFNYGRGRAKNLLKHSARPNLRQSAVIAFGPLVLMAMVAPILPALALPTLLWVNAALLGGIALAVSRREPLHLLSGPVSLLMHLSWSVGFWSQIFDRPRNSAKAVSA